MRQSKDLGAMVAVVGGMTAALSAQRALAMAAIRTDIINEDTGGRGCGYGVVFPSSQYANVRTILSNAHINVRRYKPKE